MQSPDALILGDLHIRADQPRCRADDFFGTQLKKFWWLCELWESLGKPLVLQPGDVFHKWKSTPLEISMAMNLLPPMVTIRGNFGEHNAAEWDKDGLHVVAAANKGWVILQHGDIKISGTAEVTCCAYEDACEDYIGPAIFDQVLLTHKMILEGPSVIDGHNALEFMLALPGYDLIVTGHNHAPIEVNIGNRWLLNPGSFTRQTAAETHEPRVYTWRRDGRVERIIVPHDPSVVVRDHIAEQETRQERMSAFVEHVRDSEGGLSEVPGEVPGKDDVVTFESRMRDKLSTGEVRVAVKDRIEEAMQ